MRQSCSSEEFSMSLFHSERSLIRMIVLGLFFEDRCVADSEKAGA